MLEVRYELIKPYFESFGEGGEAYTYLIKHPQYRDKIAKIFKTNDIKRNRKVKAMLETKYDKRILDFFAWPLIGIVKNGELVGYIMQFSKASSLLNVLTKAKTKFKDTPRNRVTLVKNIYLALKVFKLNFPGSIFSDISIENILVKPDGTPYFIDMDSIEFYDRQKAYRYEAKYYTDGYRSYEAIKDMPLNDNSDVFSISIITFKILMNGKHPYSAVSKTKLDTADFEQNIIHGYSAYLNPMTMYSLPDGSYEIDEVMSPRLKACYVAMMITYRAYPHIRPSADVFFKELVDMEKMMKPCSRSSGHYYMNNHCPFCKQRRVKNVAPTVKMKVKSVAQNVVNAPYQYQPYNYQTNNYRPNNYQTRNSPYAYRKAKADSDLVRRFKIGAAIITVYVIIDSLIHAAGIYQIISATLFNIVFSLALTKAVCEKLEIYKSYILAVIWLIGFLFGLALVAYVSQTLWFLGLLLLIGCGSYILDEY